MQEGMGQLRVVAGGLQLNGQAMVLDALVASSIRSRKGQPITIESSRNFTVNVRGEEGAVASQMFLGESLYCSLTVFTLASATSQSQRGVRKTVAGFVMAGPGSRLSPGRGWRNSALNLKFGPF